MIRSSGESTAVPSVGRGNEIAERVAYHSCQNHAYTSPDGEAHGALVMVAPEGRRDDGLSDLSLHLPDLMLTAQRVSALISTTGTQDLMLSRS